MTTNNYNLYIWDRNDDHLNDWVISFHKIDSSSENVYNGVGHAIELDVWLLEEEAMQLGLMNKSSFWIESKDFFSTFGNVPGRISKHMQGLPEY